MAGEGRVSARIIASMVLRKLGLWGDMWRVRRFWKLRLAMHAISVAVLAWLWLWDAGPFDRTDFYVLMVAVWVPILTNFAFWRSDQRAERARKARLAPPPRFDVYTGEPIMPVWPENPPAPR
jgi:hypothetical protein